MGRPAVAVAVRELTRQMHAANPRVDELTRVADSWRLIEHEAVDASCKQRRCDAVTGHVADSHDDTLVALEVDRGVVAAHTRHRPEIAHNFDVAPSLVGRNHAPMDTLSDFQICLEPNPRVAWVGALWCC